MSGDDVLTTSPALFFYRGRNGALAACDADTGRRFRTSSDRAAAMVTSFLEPRSIASAASEGFTPAELEEACDAGILVREDGADSWALWERRGWSRPAYLLFSQMDIPYRESLEDTSDSRELVDERRSVVDQYQREHPYPRPALLADGPAVSLPAPSPVTPRLSSLTSRRSVRRFSTSPPRADQLATVLHQATDAMRTWAADREGGDPFRLLNSFYSWAHLFVVVQAVADVPRGVFEYDWAGHRLVQNAPPPSDEDLAASVHRQGWILGTGFVVFVVADLRGYAWLYRHSRAYLHVLIQLGELGQELLMAAGDVGLGGWVTPAVHESRAGALLGVAGADGVEALSMVKLGVPAEHRRRP